MYAGASERVVMRAKRYIVSDIIDWFGTDVVFTDATEDEVTARVNVNLNAMRLWAAQYARHIRVTYPEELARDIKNSLREALENYS